jgi:hypothetical protein
MSVLAPSTAITAIANFLDCEPVEVELWMEGHRQRNAAYKRLWWGRIICTERCIEFEPSDWNPPTPRGECSDDELMISLTDEGRAAGGGVPF